MDPEIKRLWVEALRSGEYRQNIGCLEDNGAYCCLGVLCLRVKPDVNRFPTITFQERFYLEYGIPEVESSQLADMNDTGSTFPEIADYIERTL